MNRELRSLVIRYLLMSLVLAAAAVVAGHCATRPKQSSAEAAPATTPVKDEAQPSQEPAAKENAQPDGGVKTRSAVESQASRQEELVVERDGVSRVACKPMCRIEAQCGLRDEASCVKASCDGDVRVLSTSDFEIVRAGDCAQAALAPCNEACWRRGECSKDHGDDARCTDACLTLTRQQPVASYRESRCVLETPCAELALCGAVDAPAK